MATIDSTPNNTSFVALKNLEVGVATAALFRTLQTSGIAGRLEKFTCRRITTPEAWHVMCKWSVLTEFHVRTEITTSVLSLHDLFTGAPLLKTIGCLLLDFSVPLLQRHHVFHVLAANLQRTVHTFRVTKNLVHKVAPYLRAAHTMIIGRSHTKDVEPHVYIPLLSSAVTTVRIYHYNTNEDLWSEKIASFSQLPNVHTLDVLQHDKNETCSLRGMYDGFRNLTHFMYKGFLSPAVWTELCKELPKLERLERVTLRPCYSSIVTQASLSLLPLPCGKFACAHLACLRIDQHVWPPSTSPLFDDSMYDFADLLSPRVTIHVVLTRLHSNERVGVVDVVRMPPVVKKLHDYVVTRGARFVLEIEP